MDTRDYRQILEKILTDYAAIPYSYGDVKRELIVDRTLDRYLLIKHGWEQKRHIHSCLVHVDIKQDKLWIQEDNIEDGIADDLLRAGIPQQQIVLGFQSVAERKFLEFAVE